MVLDLIINRKSRYEFKLAINNKTFNIFLKLFGDTENIKDLGEFFLSVEISQRFLAKLRESEGFISFFSLKGSAQVNSRNNLFHLD